MTLIDLRPEAVDLQGYAGDTLTVRVTVSDSSVVEGGTWLAQVRETETGIVAATFSTDVGDASALLTLDAAETALLGGGFAGVWDCQVTTDVVRTLVRGRLTLASDVSR